jgi:ribosomal-protein-alanine N-acetyltransferase
MESMTADDIDQVLTIEQDIFPIPWNRISFENELKCMDSDNFIVKHKTEEGYPQIIAYISFRLVIDEMHLLKIGVAPKWRNRGIASWLLRKSMQVAAEKGAAVVYLEVRLSNIDAIAFYQKLGFEPIGRRTRYYQETGEDALVLMNRIRSKPITSEAT